MISGYIGFNLIDSQNYLIHLVQDDFITTEKVFKILNILKLYFSVGMEFAIPLNNALLIVMIQRYV